MTVSRRILAHLTDGERRQWEAIGRDYGECFTDIAKAEKALEAAVDAGLLGQSKSGKKKNPFGLDKDSPVYAHAYWACRDLFEEIHARLCWRILSCPPEKLSTKLGM